MRPIDCSRYKIAIKKQPNVEQQRDIWLFPWYSVIAMFVIIVKFFDIFSHPPSVSPQHSTYFQSSKIFYFYWLRFVGIGSFLFSFSISSFCTLYIMTQIEIPLLTTFRIWPEFRFPKTIQCGIDLLKCNLMHRFNLWYGIIRIQHIRELFFL